MAILKTAVTLLLCLVGYTFLHYAILTVVLAWPTRRVRWGPCLAICHPRGIGVLVVIVIAVISYSARR